MAAAVTRVTRDARGSFGNVVLGEARQGVILAKNGDDWFSFAPFGRESGGQSGDALGDAETGCAEFRGQQGRALGFAKAEFGVLPDLARDASEACRVGINALNRVIGCQSRKAGGEHEHKQFH